jgi:putative phosphoesterase
VQRRDASFINGPTDVTLGIISDTHAYFHPAIPEFLGDVDLILHAGDVGTPEILDELGKLAPVKAVWGNVDGQSVRVRTLQHQRIELDGLRLWMTHIGGRPGRWDRGIAAAIENDPPDVFICGHSHILRIERVRDLQNMLYINPGAAGRRGMHQVKTCVRLDIEKGAARQAQVIHLDE